MKTSYPTISTKSKYPHKRIVNNHKKIKVQDVKYLKINLKLVSKLNLNFYLNLFFPR